MRSIGRGLGIDRIVGDKLWVFTADVRQEMAHVAKLLAAFLTENFAVCRNGPQATTSSAGMCSSGAFKDWSRVRISRKIRQLAASWQRRTRLSSNLVRVSAGEQIRSLCRSATLLSCVRRGFAQPHASLLHLLTPAAAILNCSREAHSMLTE